MRKFVVFKSGVSADILAVAECSGISPVKVQVSRVWLDNAGPSY